MPSAQISHKIVKLSTYFRPRGRVSWELLGGSEGVMLHRANPLAPAVFAGSLAAAVLLGPNWAASAVDGCIEKPDLEVKQAGHWYYHVDRVHHRRCWYFETSEATVSPPSSTDRVVAPNADSEQSWFSRFAEGLAQTFSSEPQQNSIRDNSSTVTKTTPPQHPRTKKIARREGSQIVPPTTNGVASAERRDQSLLQPTAEKDEKHTPQLTATDHETLFEDFLKWRADRSIFGRP
jgi:hypothetical protein